jgi:hypothetical protein
MLSSIALPSLDRSRFREQEERNKDAATNKDAIAITTDFRILFGAEIKNSSVTLFK